MKTLSVKQPFAYLLCSGIKDIENRTWKLPEKYKGERVLIHASKTEYRHPWDVLSKEQNEFLMQNKVVIPGSTLEYGAIIGSVRFVDCVINHPSIWAEKSHYEVNLALHPLKPIYNWKAEDDILFDKPILNVKGKLGFWDYDLPEEYVKLLK